MAAAIVHFADIIIRGLGYGHGRDIWVPTLQSKAWELLRLRPTDLDKILENVEEKLLDVKGFSLEIKMEAGGVGSTSPGRG